MIRVLGECIISLIRFILNLQINRSFFLICGTISLFLLGQGLVPSCRISKWKIVTERSLQDE